MGTRISASPIRVLKIVLTVFLIYHLLAIVVLPMGSGLIIRELGRYFFGYANVLGLNTSWQFFSPGPSPIFYLEYSYTYPVVNKSDSDDDSGEFELSEAKLLPEKRENYAISDFYSRRLYSMRFLSLDESRMEIYLAPWLCRQDQRAESVTVRQKFSQLQAVEKLRGDLVAESFKDMSDPYDLPPKTFRCGESSQ